jgi:hypothetical protein
LLDVLHALPATTLAHRNVLLDDLGCSSLLLTVWSQAEEARTVLKLQPVLKLRAQEELFVVCGGQCWRWQGDPGGEPLLKALGKLVALPPEPPVRPEIERVLELLLSSLWGPDTPEFMLQFMPHPVEVPWHVGWLNLTPPASLSNGFRERWGIASVCPASSSLASPNRYVVVELSGLPPRAGSLKARIKWVYGHEYAVWEYDLSFREGVPSIVRRVLVKQHD